MESRSDNRVKSDLPEVTQAVDSTDNESMMAIPYDEKNGATGVSQPTDSFSVNKSM